MTLYHASRLYHPIGEMLVPMPGYDSRWGMCSFYRILESLKPEGMLSHHQAVFLCDNMDDLDNAGGIIDFIYAVSPEAVPERHDMFWSTKITCLADELGLPLEQCIQHPDIIAAAHNYWQSIASDMPLWEYLVPKAVVLALEFSEETQ